MMTVDVFAPQGSSQPQQHTLLTSAQYLNIPGGTCCMTRDLMGIRDWSTVSFDGEFRFCKTAKPFMFFN